MKPTFILMAISIMACSSPQKEKNQVSTNIDSVAMAKTESKDLAVSADSMALSLELLKEEGLLKILDTVTVVDDPVFHSSKTYYGLSLKTVLERFTKINQIDIKNTQIVFECEDGYNPSMELSKVLDKQSFLALQDASAPKGDEWITIKKGNETKKIAPFYVVYTDVPANEYAYKWPYNLVRIRLVPVAEELKILFPKNDELAVKGYDLFRINCLTCHALNGVGGKMGPELNAPKSVTEYWQEADIKAFVINPSSYRHEVKMPAQNQLKGREIDEIVYYLKYMAKHKVVFRE